MWEARPKLPGPAGLAAWCAVLAAIAICVYMISSNTNTTKVTDFDKQKHNPDVMGPEHRKRNPSVSREEVLGWMRTQYTGPGATSTVHDSTLYAPNHLLHGPALPTIRHALPRSTLFSQSGRALPSFIHSWILQSGVRVTPSRTACRPHAAEINTLLHHCN